MLLITLKSVVPTTHLCDAVCKFLLETQHSSDDDAKYGKINKQYTKKKKNLIFEFAHPKRRTSICVFFLLGSDHQIINSDYFKNTH